MFRYWGDALKEVQRKRQEKLEAEKNRNKEKGAGEEQKVASESKVEQPAVLVIPDDDDEDDVVELEKISLEKAKNGIIFDEDFCLGSASPAPTAMQTPSPPSSKTQDISIEEAAKRIALLKCFGIKFK